MAPNMVSVDVGRLRRGAPGYGKLVACFRCETRHRALSIARVTSGKGTSYVALCAECAVTVDATTEYIARKVLNAPDLKFIKGGKGGTA